MTNPIPIDPVVERLCDLHKRMMLCFEGETGSPPPRRPHVFEPEWADLDTLLDAAAALQSPVVSEGWQPIETAPKDGTGIILTDGEYVNADRWIEWPASGASWDEFRYLEPTYWQPLPEPPLAMSPASAPDGEDQ